MKKKYTFTFSSLILSLSLNTYANIPGFSDGLENTGTTAGVISVIVGNASSVSISGTRFTIYSSSNCSAGNLINVYYSVTGGGSETLNAPVTLHAIPSVVYDAAVLTGGQTAGNVGSVKFEILKPTTYCTELTACVPEVCSSLSCFDTNSDTPISASLNSC